MKENRVVDDDKVSSIFGKKIGVIFHVIQIIYWIK